MVNLQNALTDSLTGAQNRRYLIMNSEKFYGHYAAAFDLDHFKAVNDLEGHLIETRFCAILLILSGNKYLVFWPWFV